MLGSSPAGAIICPYSQVANAVCKTAWMRALRITDFSGRLAHQAEHLVEAQSGVVRVHHLPWAVSTMAVHPALTRYTQVRFLDGLLEISMYQDNLIKYYLLLP